MKMKSIALLVSVFLLVGALSGCDYVEPDTSNGTQASLSDAEECDTTITTTTTTTLKATTTTKKITTTKKTTTAKITTTKKSTTTEQMVWIPESGTKYHSKSSCSNMKNPSQVSKTRAIELGYSACKRCF